MSSAQAISYPSDAEWIARASRCGARRGAVRDVTLLPRHASLRRYARVGFGDRSEILMMMPAADAAPDEAGASGRTALADDPFVQVARWLADAGVRVPTVYALDTIDDAIWLEDVGSTDFDAYVSGGDDAQLLGRYRDALALLATLQAAPNAAAPPSLVTSRRFDEAILRWELDHYREWRVEAHLGRTLTSAQRQPLDAAFDRLARELAAMPTHVMHRDFQSHNIMVHDGALVALDFQDAMVGPIVYDAVALLRDSYVRIPAGVLSQLVTHYAEQVCRAGLVAATPADIERWFHMQTVQRKLKDAARFVFIDRVKGNPAFLAYIDDSVAYVREALAALGDEAGYLIDALRPLDPEAVP